MKRNNALIVLSLISIFLFAFHWADEIARGIETARLSNIFGVFILVVWLCGALVLGERRSGHIIMLLGSILGMGVLILHMRGAGLVGGRIAANSSGAFFWAWTLIALGTTATVSLILSVRELWRMRGRERM